MERRTMRRRRSRICLHGLMEFNLTSRPTSARTKKPEPEEKAEKPIYSSFGRCHPPPPPKPSSEIVRGFSTARADSSRSRRLCTWRLSGARPRSSNW